MIDGGRTFYNDPVIISLFQSPPPPPYPSFPSYVNDIGKHS